VYAKMRRNSLLYTFFSKNQCSALAELQNASSVSNRFWNWWE